jgi:hypothetical protein
MTQVVLRLVFLARDDFFGENACGVLRAPDLVHHRDQITHESDRVQAVATRVVWLRVTSATQPFEPICPLSR